MKKIIANVLVFVLTLTSIPTFADDNHGGGGGGGGGGGAAILGIAVAGLLIWALSGKKPETLNGEKNSASQDLPSANSNSMTGNKDVNQDKQPVDGIGANKKLEY